MKISIVTPTLNRSDYLALTGQSILSQTAGGSSSAPIELEWLVIDGGSTDGSVEWLAELASRDPRVRYITGPDGGQSDAINKGLAMATGDVVAWLNADDLYAPSALEAVAEAFDAYSKVQWLIGQYEVINDAGQSIRRSIVRYKQRRLARFSLPALLRQNIVPQPAVFWRRSFGQIAGVLDPTLNWTMDYDLWLRMARLSPPLILDRLLAQFRHHSASKSGNFNRRQFDEGYEVARRYAGDDHRSLRMHRLNVEKIVWGYRVLRLLGK